MSQTQDTFTPVYGYNPYANYSRLAYLGSLDDSYAAAYGYDPYAGAYGFDPYAAPQPSSHWRDKDKSNWASLIAAALATYHPGVWSYSYRPAVAAIHQYLFAWIAYRYYVAAAKAYYPYILAVCGYNKCALAGYNPNAAHEGDSAVRTNNPPETSDPYDPYAKAIDGSDPYESPSRSSRRLVTQVAASLGPSPAAAPDSVQQWDSMEHPVTGQRAL